MAKGAKGDEIRTLLPVIVNVGGLYGMNVEVLGANKTLTPGTDPIYQYLDENGANRIITLDTASATLGDRFKIRHNGVYNDTNNLEVRQAAIVLDQIYAGAIKEFIFDGTNWVAGETGAGENDNKNRNITIGYQAKGYASGVAIGRGAAAFNDSVAVGRDASGASYGVAVGFGAVGAGGVAVGNGALGQSGVAVGRSSKTNYKLYSIALGYRSECERTAETSININGSDSDQENNVVQGRWEGQLAGGAGATEILCGGQVGQRFLIRNNSVLAFRMIITARDNVANEVAMYTVDDGLIKKAGANTAAVVVGTTTVVVVHEDDAGWDCAVAVDGGGNNLIITVTGDVANITQWAAVLNGIETHF